MRTKISTVLLIPLLSAVAIAAEGNEKTASNPTFSLPPAASSPESSKFSGAQLAYVQSWIAQKVPECSPAVSEAVAEQFLDELQQRYPEKLDKLTSANLPLADFESMLLRTAATKLPGSAQLPAREEMARRRLAVVLVAGGKEVAAAKSEAAVLMEKIKEGSQTQYRRLVDGRMDDDDLQLLIKKTGQVGLVKKEPEPVKPKVLTATDIVAEFSRRNQAGSSLQRLQAYVVEGHLKTASGEQQELLLFRMRPDCFRLIVRSSQATRYILAASSGRFWQQTPGQAAQSVPLLSLGDRRYLTEFVDPLFLGDDYTFERLEDGKADGRAFHRITVRRADGSHYVARIDTENFREIGRENADHSTARYSDFREIAGVVYAFREEITDKAGQTGVLELSRVSPNPGLISNLFELPVRSDLGYFELERELASASPAGMKFN